MNDTSKKISLSKLSFGCDIKDDITYFTTFAIDADKVSVAIYDAWNSVRRTEYKMHEVEDNVWTTSIDQNLSSKFYTYIIIRGENRYITTDPFSFSLSLNSSKTAILDKKLCEVKNFETHKVPKLSYKDAIIYEMHIRDFTSSSTINVKNKNKYLGLTESDQLETGEKIGFNHIKELGVSHIHLLPILDFVTVDEEDANGYNWGYDPDSFFALEGSYATEPSDPYSRITEFKETVMHYHKNNIGIILDVVYNHTYHGLNSNFEILAPGIFYRNDEDGKITNGSGCGNEINTEDPLVIRVICESLKHLICEYKVDGFRFDLLGLMDRMSMYGIVKELRKVNPNVLIYGEPWVGGHSALDHRKRVYKGTQANKHFSLFNDDYRNAIKGDNDGVEGGYVQGELSKLEAVKIGVLGSLKSENTYGFTSYPYESVNYTCSHDNLILYDKIKKSCDGVSHDDNIKMNKLAFFLTIMSFGIPFIHEGTEFARTKYMDFNSYRSGDYVNGIDWQLKHDNNELFKYVKKLLILRKKMPFFSSYNKNDIYKYLKFYNNDHSALIYEIYDKKSQVTYMFFINPNDMDVACGFAYNEFDRVLCDSIRMREYKIKEDKNDPIILSRKSAMILTKRKR